MTISPVYESELGKAIGLLRGPSADSVESHESQAARLLASGKLALADVLVARRDNAISGAVFGQVLPGSTGVIWPARSTDGDPAIEDALNAAALEHIGNVNLVQAFLTPEELGRADSLVRCGFRHITRVWEMRRPGGLSPLAPRNGGRGEIRLLRFAEVDGRLFDRTLLRCHEDSLDCPEMQDCRTPEDVLAGYRDCAPNMDQWWLAEANAEPAGVLLLADRELIFVGIVPQLRGQGLGRSLVHAACEKSSELSLVVDVRNAPAVQLYVSVGFEVVGAREVFLKSSPGQLTPSARKSSNTGE